MIHQVRAALRATMLTLIDLPRISSLLVSSKRLKAATLLVSTNPAARRNPLMNSPFNPTRW
jgi:hypothetical protein